MERQYDIRILILSHLSDAQHLMNAGRKKEANDCINFAKLLLFEFVDIDSHITDSRLAELWDAI